MTKLEARVVSFAEMRIAAISLMAVLCALAVACGSTHRVTVPNVTAGTDIRTAFAHLRAVGLRVTVSRPFSVDDGALPSVARQRPRAGAKVTHGTAVSLQLGPPLGPPVFSRPGVRVPHVTGLLLSRAVARLEAAKLPNWSVTDLVVREATARDLFDAFRVFAQQPAAGKTVTSSQPLTLRVRPTKGFPE